MINNNILVSIMKNYQKQVYNKWKQFKMLLCLAIRPQFSPTTVVGLYPQHNESYIRLLNFEKYVPL